MNTPHKQPVTGDAGEKVRFTLVDLAYRKMPGALIATLVVVILMFAFFQFSSSRENLMPWISGFVLILLFRLLTWLVFRQKLRLFQVVLNRNHFDIMYHMGVLATGCIWGGMILWLLPELDLKGQVLLFVIILGMTSGAIPTMAYRPVAMILFILQLMVPLGYMTFALDIPNKLAVFMTLTVYAMFLIRTVVDFYHSTKEMLVLQQQARTYEQKLLLQREKAQLANRAKSEFLSRMSHELRTPLNAVLGMNDLLKRDKSEPLTDKQRMRTEKINEAASHLLQLVNDVLDLARVEEGDIEIQTRAVECVSLLRDVLALVEPRIQGRDIELKLGFEQETVWLRADPTRLKQVFINLIDNAIKYNRQGGSIFVEIKPVSDTNWRISIVDTGYGLTPEDIEKLFLPFSRLGAEHLGIEGTGIGLSYTRQLVELMDGKVGVESRPGKGSCFWVELPDGEDQREQTVESGSEPLYQQISEVPGSVLTSLSHRILLAEDNEVNQEVVVDMLEQLGCEIDIASTGKEALEACRQHKYALVLMDCEMPVMDGLTATRKIREDENRQQKKPVPIVALTAHAISGAREKCLSVGMNDFLSKPFSFEDIYTIVEKWTGLRINEQMISAAFEPAQDSDNIDSEKADVPETVIDMAVIERLRKSQQDRKKSSIETKQSLVKRVISMYLAQTPGLLQQLTEVLKLKDIEKITDIVHSLKSSSSAIGAVSLADSCREAESAGRSENPEMADIEHLVLEIHHKYQQVELSLKEILISES